MQQLRHKRAWVTGGSRGIGAEMNPADGPYADAIRERDLAVPRHGTAVEVAGPVAYLAGPEAGLVTGATLGIDGGFSA